MNDFDKVKEKNKKDDFKGIIILSIIFLIAFALIVFAIIKLTNQYFDLKMQLNESRNEQQVQLTDPSNGQTFQFNATDEKSDIQRSEEDLRELSEMSILDDEKQSENDKIHGSVETDEVQDKGKPAENNEEISVSKKEENNKNVSEKESGSKTDAVSKKKGDYLVQILAVKSKTDADRAAEALRKIVSDVYVVRADLGDKGIWYRLRCCKDTNAEYAKSVVDKIKNETSYSPMILKTGK